MQLTDWPLIEVALLLIGQQNIYICIKLRFYASYFIFNNTESSHILNGYSSFHIDIFCRPFTVNGDICIHRYLVCCVFFFNNSVRFGIIDACTKLNINLLE
jgi:hypothetical protein